MIALIGGIILLALSGLATLAFKYPKAFDKLWGYLFFASITIYLFFVTWKVAILFCAEKVKQFVLIDKVKQFEATYNSLTTPLIWTNVIEISFITYMTVLFVLQKFIEKHKE